MRRVWLLLSMGFALWAVWAPHLAQADVLCQHRNSKKTVLMSACVGKYKLVYNFDPVTQLQSQVESLRASVAALQARLPVGASDLVSGAVTRDKVAANAIDGTKVIDASLELNDLAVSLILPYPSNAIGNHFRIVAAHLNMSLAAGGISVANQTGANWLAVTSSNLVDVSSDFAIGDDVFVGQPQCVASVTDAGNPDAPHGLEVSVFDDGTPPAASVRVRVVGPSRAFDVQGTLLCIGVAKL